MLRRVCVAVRQAFERRGVGIHLDVGIHFAAGIIMK